MEDLKPSSREEAVLAKIAGIEDPMVDAFEPSSREEWFMNEIANKMAEGGGGSGGGVLVVNLHMESDEGKSGGMRMVCDKTADEMFQAIETKSVVLKIEVSEAAAYMHIITANNADGYSFMAYDTGGNRIYLTSTTADGYPSYSAS